MSKPARLTCVLTCLLMIFAAAAAAQEQVQVSAPIVRAEVPAQSLDVDLRDLQGLAPQEVWVAGAPVRVIEDLKESDGRPPGPTSTPESPATPPTTPPTIPPTTAPPTTGPAIEPSASTQDLRDLPTAPLWREGDPVRVMPDLRVIGERHPELEGLAQESTGQMTPSATTAALVINPNIPIRGIQFDGIPATGSIPPDTNGDVGPNHYIQIVNTSFSIYNRAGGLLVGPLAINSLWNNFGGPCQTNNNGDPIVRYDHAANRWLISQFALPAGTKYECIAISKTADPVAGGWYLYAFPMVVGTTQVFPDYPKIGVWPNGYFMGTQRGFPNGGLDVWAFERARMLAGQPARQVQFAVSGTSLFLMPVDADGPPPPANTAAYFVRQVDGQRFGGLDRIEMFQFNVNWGVNPPTASFAQLPNLNVNAFDSVLCNTSLLGACIPQPGTAQLLESLTVWTMFRAQYRNFLGNETILLNHTVDANGADLAGIRWYELRRPPAGVWAVSQQGTYAPNNIGRWMGSISMDASRNVAVGYSVSSSTVFPGLRLATRSALDPLNVLTRESLIVAGGGSQTHASARWGNYSSMDVDPVNDCTFWYTSEYYATTSAAGWRTRIASFTMPSCAGPPGSFVVTNESIGAFAVWSTSANVKRLVGDYNADGRSDIALTGPSGWGSIPVAFSNGDGTFTVTNFAVANFPAWAALANAKALVGDYNADGRSDIALTGVSGWGSIPVAFSNGNGSFNVTNNAVPNFGAWSATANVKHLQADYNADGRTDILLTGASGWGSIPVAFSLGNGAFNITNAGVPNFPGWSANSAAKHLSGDFNNDNRADVALTGVSGWGSIPVAFSNGNGTFNVTNAGVPNWGAWAATPGAQPIVGDYNADGRRDIALTGAAGWGSVPVAFSNGNGTFNITNAPILNFGAWSATANVKRLGGDYNKNGRADIALTGAAGWSTIPVAFSNGNGSFNVTNSFVGAFAAWASSAGVMPLTGDYDGNGKTDIALTGASGWTTLPIAFSISQ